MLDNPLFQSLYSSGGVSPAIKNVMADRCADTTPVLHKGEQTTPYNRLPRHHDKDSIPLLLWHRKGMHRVMGQTVPAYACAFYPTGNPDPKKKGWDYMNIFSTNEWITGPFNPDSLKDSLQAVFTLANRIREKLGRKGYLVDSYLSIFFESAAWALNYDSSEDGRERSTDLWALCSAVISHSDTEKNHPLYPRAVQLLSDLESSLDFQENSTRGWLLYLFLADDLLSTALKFFRQDMENQITQSDFPSLSEIYDQIVGITGENQMDQLNLLLKHRFILSPLVSTFLQGLNSELMYLMTERDMETSRQVFQLYMEILRKKPQ